MRLKRYQPTLSLKPTQFSVGMVEVEYKVDEMLRLKPRKREKLIDANPIPVVLSPWNELCVIDHHHFLFSCWHANIAKVRVKVVKDYSRKKLNYVQFWRMMAREKNAYLIDQFGDGPRNPLYLPDDVRGMADDPYRSLAWIVRKEGGYEKSKESFAEFRWADFFRQRKLLNLYGKAGLRENAGRALTLAKSPAARHLPGYLNQAKIRAHVKKSLAKTVFVPESQTTGPLASVAKMKKETREKEAKVTDKRKTDKKKKRRKE